MPEFLYKTRDLAQPVSGAFGRDLRDANLVLKHMREAASTGKARIELTGIPRKPMFVFCCFTGQEQKGESTAGRNSSFDHTACTEG